MAVKLTILGSGSAGNASYVETDETRVLVDCGFSPRQIRQRLATIGRVPENLTAILITHEHGDHIAGLVGIAEKFGIPVYCNRATKDEIERTLKAHLDFRLFTAGGSFEVGDIAVETFSIPHDAQDENLPEVHLGATGGLLAREDFGFEQGGYLRLERGGASRAIADRPRSAATHRGS